MLTQGLATKTGDAPAQAVGQCAGIVELPAPQQATQPGQFITEIVGNFGGQASHHRGTNCLRQSEKTGLIQDRNHSG